VLDLGAPVCAWEALGSAGGALVVIAAALEGGEDGNCDDFGELRHCGVWMGGFWGNMEDCGLYGR